MAMSLCNRPEPFPKLMNSVVFDFIDHFVVAYFNALLVYSRTNEEHTEHLRAVIE